MKELLTYEEVETWLKKDALKLFYISSEGCSVCTALRPKVEQMLTRYPKIETAHLLINNAERLAGELSIFTAPVLILFLGEKEILRFARFISMDELEEKVEKYYNLIINEIV